MKKKLTTPLLLVAMMLLAQSCYMGKTPDKVDASTFTQRQLDSLNFAQTHHYSENYNFVVSSDSLVLLSGQPEEVVVGMTVDSFAVKKDARLVVADIKILSAATELFEDSVWVEVATENYEFGWTTERQLLRNVVPDDPISQFISSFSDAHLLVFLAIIVLIASAYVWRLLLRRQMHIVHLRDIPSLYPTLLAILVASAASLYASIQMFAPDEWQHFYFHPSLNPLSESPLLAIFLASVWGILIVGIAAADEVRRLLPLGDAAVYLGGLACVCAINYVVFSISTLYYVGYLLLAVYVVFALFVYFTRWRARYVCGRCGAALSGKGRCPRCGTLNTVGH